MKAIKTLVAKILYRPYITFLLCLLFLFFNLVLDRTLFRAFHLNRDLRIVKNRIEHIKGKNRDTKNKIKKASDPDVVEKAVRKRLDYMDSKDLIFIFPEKI